MLIAGADRLRGLHREAQRLRARRPAAPVRQQHPRGHRRGRPGAVQRGVRAGPGRPGRAARARRPACDELAEHGYDPATGRLAVSTARRCPGLLADAGRRGSAAPGCSCSSSAIRGLPPRPSAGDAGALDARLTRHWSACAARSRSLVGIRGAGGRPAGWWPASAWRCWSSAGAGLSRCGRGAQGHGPAGGPGHLDRVAARHDRRRGRAWSRPSPPRLRVAGAVDPRAADPAGGPAAHPGADARGAAHVRRRPGRPERGPDHRGADHQRPAARPGPARPARRAVRTRCARSWTCAARSTPSAGPPGAASRSWSASRSAWRWSWPCSTTPSWSPTTASFGQLVLRVVVGIYAAGIFWLRRLARFDGAAAAARQRPAAAPAGHPAAAPDRSPADGREAAP